ncbi:hypothetical protein Q0Z83_015080 [Actinoplanes sichuanensis]|uniref:Uncharacterized protein n=1 Tax=Actinoplanes sichuanensis TaxID=512349 RepID=A0ABW4A7N9_9ACTN|nr:hypothetical protein [Actinoplanes sichuanensis]BEL03317.1 hypothetical protein Q0Z83_015080 [Actinoplanes sichuanensis]
MDLSVVLPIIGPVVGVAGLTIAILNRRGVTRQQEVSRYREVRKVVRSRQGRLGAVAWETADPAWKAAPVPVLTRPGWILETPLPLDRVGLRLLPGSEVPDRSGPSAERAARLLPRRESNRGRLRYSEALVDIDGLDHLHNGNVYRPVAVEADGRGLSIDFIGGRYFDHLDTSEILAFETAAGRGRRFPLRRSYRRSLGDPFDLHARATSLGVLTLTVIKTDDGARFLMHSRDDNQVVVGSKAMHVVPAGEFTPASVYLEADAEDFDIWRTIMREYAEELLDREEAYGKEGSGLHYADEPPFRELEEARRSGALHVYALGLGLDPLTWKPELFTVCVFEPGAAERIFQAAVKRTWEGTVLRGTDGRGLRFDAATVRRYSGDPNTRRGASACLDLAWRHRDVLGIS